METSGHLVVLEYSSGTKRVHSDAQLAPTDLRREVSDAVEDDVDVDEFSHGEKIGTVRFEDILGDTTFEYEIFGWVQEGED